ncbi:Efflux pump periplasmic linker BepD precursor [Neorhodopirellula pilleata]|uniref:Efflux pump periplasmic linker BepD n=1 Tax=Neorhodopirellula pilleata TaxID=2714738 RepID=A0A5C5ZW31_9BACT|nr:Efflux pump periplasmic linker BepD precursor [Neorhodopirellula pilleata]
MSEQVVGTAGFLRPVRDQEEPAWHQVQLPGLGVRLIDNDQNQSLCMLPSVDLVRTKLDGVLIAACRWTPRRTNDVLGGQRIELWIGLQSPRKTPVFRCQSIHHSGDRVAGIKPIVDVLRDRVSFRVRLVDESLHAIGGVNLNLAELRYERAQSLSERNAASQEEVDERQAAYLQAKADIEAVKAGVSSADAAIASAEAEIELAKAGVETAELNLDFTRIEAPISGLISRQYVTKGNLITGGSATSSLLTTITSMNPIYCVFDASEQDVLKYIRLDKSGERESSRVAKNPVFLGLIDEEGFPHKGYINFVDNRFDVDTASMRARGVFNNKDELMLPGMFARIRIPGSAAREAVLIPDSAIGTDQASQYVYIVVDRKIQRRAVTTGPIVDGLRVIRKGLNGDEMLVTEGLLQVRDQMKVNVPDETIKEVQATDDGLPDDYELGKPEDLISPAPDQLSAEEVHGE